MTELLTHYLSNSLPNITMYKNPKIQHRLHGSSPFDPVLCQFIPNKFIVTYFSSIHKYYTHVKKKINRMNNFLSRIEKNYVEISIRFVYLASFIFSKPLCVYLKLYPTVLTFWSRKFTFKF